MEAAEKTYGFIKDSRGQRSRRTTTKGWEFLIKRRDVSESWIPLADLKEYKPLDITEYATRNKIEKEPVFSWWVPPMLKKCSSIIPAVASRVRIKSMKHGMKILHDNRSLRN